MPGPAPESGGWCWSRSSPPPTPSSPTWPRWPPATSSSSPLPGRAEGLAAAWSPGRPCARAVGSLGHCQRAGHRTARPAPRPGAAAVDVRQHRLTQAGAAVGRGAAAPTPSTSPPPSASSADDRAIDDAAAALLLRAVGAPLHLPVGASRAADRRLGRRPGAVVVDAVGTASPRWPACRTPSSCSSPAVPRPARCRRCARSPRPAGASTPTGCGAWAARGPREGWDLRVMYGQTEATARMAVSCRPARRRGTRTSVGCRSAGGRFRVDRAGGDLPAGEVGELHLRGART